jgi:hypothetical protein
VPKGNRNHVPSKAFPYAVVFELIIQLVVIFNLLLFVGVLFVVGTVGPRGPSPEKE